jgi:hypothetical protein
MNAINKYLTKCPECDFKAFLINRVIECPDCGCEIEYNALEPKDEALNEIDEYDLEDVGVTEDFTTKQLNRSFENE